jgi:holin-like protein
MRSLIAVVLQVAGLLVINKAGYVAVSLLRLPLPGNVLGMLLLLALLGSGVVPLRWIESSASLLVRHLAFFFIPITVGLMGVTDLFVDNGVAIALTLIVSAGVGICAAGLSSQGLVGLTSRRTR